MGVGIALGYGVALFDKVRVPQTEELVNQVKDISSISEITYSDGTVIASIESDLLRTSISSEQISENLKKAIIATEDEHFKEHICSTQGGDSCDLGEICRFGFL